MNSESGFSTASVTAALMTRAEAVVPGVAQRSRSSGSDVGVEPCRPRRARHDRQRRLGGRLQRCRSSPSIVAPAAGSPSATLPVAHAPVEPSTTRAISASSSRRRGRSFARLNTGCRSARSRRQPAQAAAAALPSGSVANAVEVPSNETKGSTSSVSWRPPSCAEPSRWWRCAFSSVAMVEPMPGAASIASEPFRLENTLGRCARVSFFRRWTVR